MKSDVLLFFLFFGLASAGAAATSFLLFAMVGEINRKKDERSQVPYFSFSWPRVWREYGLLYPEGRYRRALLVATVFAGVFGLIAFYFLFGVLPKYALPSR
jgi:hypothetical protein